MARRDPVLAEVYEGGDMALDKGVLHSRPEDQPVDDFDMMTLTARPKPSAKPVTQDQEEKTIIENTVRSRVSGQVHRLCTSSMLTGTVCQCISNAFSAFSSRRTWKRWDCLYTS